MNGVVLATLCLNEMEWLPRLYEQHRNWPGLVRWVFVEAADRVYAEANPRRVSFDGLSMDGTTEYLMKLAAEDELVEYVPHGFADHPDPARCKIAARQRYMDAAEEVRPKYLIQLDADEFYTREDQGRVCDVMRSYPEYLSFTMLKREIWRPPSIRDQPLLQYEVVGGFWGIACCHWWNWQPGMAYRECHITPSTADGRPTNDRLLQLHDRANMPQMLHLGYAAGRGTRTAKNRYYVERGEYADPQRRWYTQSRASWEEWQPGHELAKDAKVIPYTGPVPECFR